MLAKLAGGGSRPARSAVMAAAATLACALAQKPDLGIGAAMVASPRTYTPGTWTDSNRSARTGTQPVSSVTPARSAISPAFCGGMTFSTSALWRVPKAVRAVRVLASTSTTSPSSLWPTHSIISP